MVLYLTHAVRFYAGDYVAPRGVHQAILDGAPAAHHLSQRSPGDQTREPRVRSPPALPDDFFSPTHVVANNLSEMPHQ